MTPENIALAKEVVHEKVTSNKLFTAFEISLEVQEKARQQGVSVERHRDMKSEIHEAIAVYSVINGGTYDRTLMDVGAPGNVSAWVYHPENVDPYKEYKPLDRTPFDNPQMIPTAQPVVTATAIPVKLPDGAHKIDSQGRICFPVEMVKSLNLTPEDTCMVTFGTKGQVSIKKDAPADPASNTPYSVDVYGNVRVSRFTLRKAGLEGVELFKFKQDADEVIAAPFAPTTVSASLTPTDTGSILAAIVRSATGQDSSIDDTYTPGGEGEDDSD
jgi:bifunctional DNA-binding transcriptional regulator/antitoxin component of YhaV-PrlF toxin-antitoxin module